MKKLLLVIVLAGTALLARNSTQPLGFNPRKFLSYELDSDSSELRLLFAGDIMAHDVNYTRQPYTNIYTGIREATWDADLSFANLEFVFDPAKPPSGYPRFNAPVSYVTAAIEGGFNVFSIANNHSLDLGAQAAINSLAEIEKLAEDHQIFYNGLNKSESTRFDPTFFELGGMKVGFLAITSFLNWLRVDHSVNVVPFYDNAAEDELVARVRRESGKVNLFILSYHGGIEYRTEPVLRKKQFFLRLISAGVDIIWSHHPHVVQPWETVQTNEGDKLILYSTGNFISGQTWGLGPESESTERKGTGDSALYKVVYESRKGAKGVKRIQSVPVFNYQDHSKGMVVKQYSKLFSLDMSPEWLLYYKNRYVELTKQLFDNSDWGLTQ
ncbi:MAG: CapA family protein [Spirochaetales bacterium]|nr:CapA family protein [Spirochaetales bacterium]